MCFVRYRGKGFFLAYEAIIKAKGKDPAQFFTDLPTFRAWHEIDWHKNIEKIDGVYIDNAVINAIFHAYYDPYVGLFSWVRGILAHLSGRYNLAVLSSSSIQSVRTELGDVEQFFDIVIGAEMVTRLKPHPEGVHSILNHFGVAPETALIIGDTHQDYHAGASAGIRTALVQWGLGEWNDLLDLNADFYFEKPEELFRL